MSYYIKTIICYFMYNKRWTIEGLIKYMKIFGTLRHC